MKDAILTDLAREALAIAESEEHRARRRLWVSFHDLRPPRALVHYAMYAHVWAREIADPGIWRHQDGLARALEVQLRARIWKARHIADDEPLLPTLWLSTPRPPGREPLWGVALPMRRTEDLGAYKPEPPVRSEDDLDRIVGPLYAEDGEAKRRLIEEASELVDGVVPVKCATDELHYGPFEWAVRMRGMDDLLFDVYDRPDFVHRLVERITAAMVDYHRDRERAGAIDAEESWSLHPVYDEVTAAPSSALAGCWAYVHAQSAASFSPRMYAEFVQPYNERIAALFGRVYYHGCEDLSAKSAIIRNLPHLRLFHVGPWTPVAPVVANLGPGFALEVHSNPADTVFAFGRGEMRADLTARHGACGEMPHVLKLCDVETVRDRPAALSAWAEEARRVVGA